MILVNKLAEIARKHRAAAITMGLALQVQTAAAFDLYKEGLAVPGEFIVQSQSSPSDLRAYFSSQTSAQVREMPNSQWSKVTFPVTNKGWINFNDYLDILEKAPGVNDVQPNYVYFSNNISAYNGDPLLSKQWQIDAINAQKAWAVGGDASLITIAIIDDAVFVEHEDLRANLWVNSKEIPGNGKDDDGNSYIDDVNGWNFGNRNSHVSPQGPNCSHGTHVAGLAGAVGGNGKGGAGIAPNVKLMALPTGVTSRNCSFASAAISEAIRYAVDNGANIINMSLGGPFPDPTQKEALQYASDNNVLVVVAAGNDGFSKDIEDLPTGMLMRYAKLEHQGKIVARGFTPSYPAAFSREIPAVLTIANASLSTTGAQSLQQASANSSWTHEKKNIRIHGDKLSDDGWTKLPKGTLLRGSSYGQKTVQLVTPGTEVWSTWPYGPDGQITSSYKANTGTSMASPITAGAAALVWANFPDMTNLQIKERLLRGSKINPNFDNKIQNNRQLDVYQALCGEMFARKASGCSKTKSSTAITPNPVAPPVNVVKPIPPKISPKPIDPKDSLKDKSMQLNDWIKEN